MKELLKKFDPITMAIEDTFHSINVKSALLLGQAKGVLLLAAASMGIPSASYAPRKVKQSITGNGNADKTQVQYMVIKILNIKTTSMPLDASDALGIALCHLNQLKVNEL